MYECHSQKMLELKKNDFLLNFKLLSKYSQSQYFCKLINRHFALKNCNTQYFTNSQSTNKLIDEN